jgi:cell division protein FtsZ
MIYEPDVTERQAVIKVIGVGGAGGNAIDTMIRQGLEGAEFLVANTDRQALEKSLAPVKINIGFKTTRGLGAGADPEVGKKAAEEDRERLKEALAGADMIFIAAGMGKGTGTGAAPVIAEISKELGALTIAVVTRPFTHEGRQRQKNAEKGLQELVKAVDTLIVIPNDRILQVAGRSVSFRDAFRIADQVLYQSVRGITDIITIPGEVNVDFADVRTVMSNRGMAVMGIGEAEGEGRAVKAAEMAISNPLLEDVRIDGARAVLINITGTERLGIHEFTEACTFLQGKVHEDANIIAGIAVDPTIGEKVRVTVIATGFGEIQFDRSPRPSLKLVAPENPQGEAPILHPVPPGKAQPQEIPPVPKLHEQLGRTLYDSDEYDIPAFLRYPKHEKS